LPEAEEETQRGRIGESEIRGTGEEEAGKQRIAELVSRNFRLLSGSPFLRFSDSFFRFYQGVIEKS